MRTKNGIVLAIGLLVVATAGWWFASPWWTLKAMRDAAAAHDERALSAHVDYPALRASLKDQMMARMTSPGGAESGNAIVKLVTATIAGPLIDAAVTPQGVQAMFEVDDGRTKNGATSEISGGPSGGQLPRLPAAKDRPVIEHSSLDEFRVHAREPGSATMVFRRYGLGWKLAGVDLSPAS